MPAASYAIVGSVVRRVDSPASTWPGSASDWMRAAVLTMSPGHHALAVGADRDGGLAGEHARPRSQVVHPDLVAERRDRRDQVERGANRALGVVLRATGVPQTAITASPMNFSTVPP